jgi:hypothetical protein
LRRPVEVKKKACKQAVWVFSMKRPDLQYEANVQDEDKSGNSL